MVEDKTYFENEATVSYKDMIKTNKVFGENVTYMQGMLEDVIDKGTIKVRAAKSKDELDKGTAGTKEVKFDYLVICTGSHYKISEKNVTDVAHIVTKKERGDLLAKYRKEIKDAKKVLIIGGGATGVEMLAEIMMKYAEDKDKKYAIMTASDQLLSGFPKDASDLATEYVSFYS